jgi:GNAT superfamily N-acetyltransferase
MARASRRGHAAAMATVETRYRYLVVDEDGIGIQLRHGLAMLLAAILDDGEVYRRRAWRTLRPTFRVIATQADGEPIGQASAFSVPTRPPIHLVGIGDVAVAPDHRRRQVARTVCGLAVQEAWRLHATAILLKTKPLRTVFADLGFEAATEPFFYMERGERTVHPDWMAAFTTELPPSVELEEGDF